MKKDIILIGGGGHAKVVIDAILAQGVFNIRGIIDKDPGRIAAVSGIKVIGDDDALEGISREISCALITVGSIGDPTVRKNIYKRLRELKFELPVIIHPKAVVAKDVRMGEGTFVAAGAVINPGTRIGRNAIINTSASVDHDCEIGDFVHIAPGAILSGGVRIGDGTHIGTGTNVIQYVNIGKNCMVAAGMRIADDLGDGHRKSQRDSRRVFIIAEAGVNHNGDIDIAKRMIDAASEAGADAIKFQTFRPENLASSDAPKADYQKRSGPKDESQYDMLKRLELDPEAHRELIDYCKGRRIEFLSSAFDLESIDLLEKLGVETFKIPSGEITNLPFLRKIGSLKKKIILSTGMSDLDEVKNALAVIISAGTKRQEMTVLHCNSAYPTPVQDVNLNAMLTIERECDVKVGYSDHTEGIEAAIGAVALGASIIEKHFTLDKSMEGPDHSASLQPDEFKKMVDAIMSIEKALGTRDKKPSASEIKNRPVVRKSIVALKEIEKGMVFSESNLTAKRPGNGISPMRWDDVIGKKAKRSFKRDEAIEL